MPRKPKVEEPIETPVVEEVVEAVISEEAPVAPEEVKAEAPLPSKEVEVSLGTIGPKKLKIIKLVKKEVNGVPYNEVTLEDRATYLLSDRDLELQVNK